MKNSTKTSTKKQKLQSHTALQQFLQKAAAYKLSAGAILLWQSVYFAAQRKGKYSNVVLCTADLMAALGITRNGLQKIRRMLTEAGLLEVRVCLWRFLIQAYTRDWIKPRYGKFFAR